MFKKKKKKINNLQIKIPCFAEWLEMKFFQVHYFYVYAQHLIPAVVYQR